MNTGELLCIVLSNIFCERYGCLKWNPDEKPLMDEVLDALAWIECFHTMFEESCEDYVRKMLTDISTGESIVANSHIANTETSSSTTTTTTTTIGTPFSGLKLKIHN